MDGYNEGYRQGSSGNPLYVPSTPEAIAGHFQGKEERRRQQAAASSPPISYEIAPLTWEQHEAIWRGVKIASLVLAICATIFGLVYLFANHFMPDGRYVGKTVYYDASQLNRFYEIPWMARSKPLPLDYQKSIVISGDMEKVRVDAYWDVTIQGSVTNSTITSRVGMITVENAKDSVLAGHRVLVKGTAENVKQRITR